MQELIIAISTTALFDLKEEKQKYKEEGEELYYKHQLENQANILKPGVGFNLIQKFLNLDAEMNIKVIVVSKNNVGSSIRIMNSIEYHKLNIQQSIWTTGQDVVPFLKTFGVDLFISTNYQDVADCLNNDIAAAHLMDYNVERITGRLSIAFDGDSVLFSNASEKIYKSGGVDEFNKHEIGKKDEILEDGPYRDLFEKLGQLQKEVGKEDMVISLVTARSNKTMVRVINTLEKWGVQPTYALFMCGEDKTPALRALEVDMFFDDQFVHIQRATSMGIPSAQVVDGEVG